MLGYIAAGLTTASFAPQAWLIIRTQRVTGISLTMYSMFTLGVMFWLIYGLFSGDIPLVIANAITFMLAATILCITAKTRDKLKARGVDDGM